MRIVPEFDSRGFEEQADRLHADLRRALPRGMNGVAQRVLEGLRHSMDEHLDEPTGKDPARTHGDPGPARAGA